MFSKNGFVFAQFREHQLRGERRKRRELRFSLIVTKHATARSLIIDHWYHGNYWNEMIEFQILSYLSIANKYLHINLQNAAAFKNSLSIKQENFSNLPCWEYLFHSWFTLKYNVFYVSIQHNNVQPNVIRTSFTLIQFLVWFI